MAATRLYIALNIALIATLLGSGCAVVAARPCTDGGDPAKDKAVRGTKKCQQTKDKYGQWVNHGNYTEWYPNGSKAAEGEYRWGRKFGRWYEWDEKGKMVSDKFFEDGEVQQTHKDQDAKKPESKFLNNQK